MCRPFLVAAALLFAVGTSSASAQTYTVFDVPGAVFGVFPTGISATGEVTGRYLDAVNRAHGFVRSPSGQITTFDVPGAAAGTFPMGINSSGTITGYFWAEAYSPQGFVRTSDGAIRVYDVPSSYYTEPYAINAAGDIAGYFTPLVTPVAYPTGFVLAAGGALSTFSFPGAPNADSIAAYAMNDQDDTVGNADVEGFFRASDGTITLFSVPGPAVGVPETFPRALNNGGTATGYAYNQLCGGPEGANCILIDVRSFLRAADGTLTVFRMPNSSLHGTWAQGINNLGTVVGYFFSGSSHAAQGFIRRASGARLAFSVPNMNQTAPVAINDVGVIVGRCSDAAGVHGFVRSP